MNAFTVVVLGVLLLVSNRASSQALRRLPPANNDVVRACNDHDADDKRLLPLYTVSVRFRNLIRGYRVSATWHPSQVYHGVTGPAIVRFQEKSNGRTHVFVTNHFSLPMSALKSEYVTDSLTIDPSINGARIQLEYPLYDAVTSDARERERLNTPFVFRDVDFDGKDEVVFTHAGGGQRSSEAYRAYSLTCQCRHVLLDYHDKIEGPAGSFDALTSFDAKSTKLTKELSGGACGSVFSTYAWQPVDNLGQAATERELLLTTITEYEVAEDGQCYVVTYTVSRSKRKEVSRVKVE